MRPRTRLSSAHLNLSVGLLVGSLCALCGKIFRPALPIRVYSCSFAFCAFRASVPFALNFLPVLKVSRYLCPNDVLTSRTEPRVRFRMDYRQSKSTAAADRLQDNRTIAGAPCQNAKAASLSLSRSSSTSTPSIARNQPCSRKQNKGWSWVGEVRRFRTYQPDAAANNTINVVMVTCELDQPYVTSTGWAKISFALRLGMCG